MRTALDRHIYYLHGHQNAAKATVKSRYIVVANVKSLL